MNILRVKDENGKWADIPAIKGADGKDYVLTDADKREIASMISATAMVADVPATVSELENDAGYLTAKDLQGYAMKTEIPTVPTKVSAFANDAGYLTQHQSLAGYALKTEIPNVSAYQTEAQVVALIRAEMESARIAYVGSGTPANDLGDDGDIYIVSG